MKQSTALLHDLHLKLQAAKAELAEINRDEALLEWPKTLAPDLPSLIELIDPYYQLWHVAYKFHQCHDKWFHGIAKMIFSTGDSRNKNYDLIFRTLLKSGLANDLHGSPADASANGSTGSNVCGCSRGKTGGRYRSEAHRKVHRFSAVVPCCMQSWSSRTTLDTGTSIQTGLIMIKL